METFDAYLSMSQNPVAYGYAQFSADSSPLPPGPGCNKPPLQCPSEWSYRGHQYHPHHQDMGCGCNSCEVRRRYDNEHLPYLASDRHGYETGFRPECKAYMAVDPKKHHQTTCKFNIK